ncbi:helix-turn-helix domain-containing protein [Algoriphagus boritolerans]|uniref:Transcriptional regulator, AraC family n=1 Tax=Algoriphagus boritolerans DSM 17298 = JCM 18970 TaxID=1120964 RepID=A0A1H5Y3D3_9BACT|nr:AraC family transcriptional regulator [Algoriphagus boritolerans]SEG18120.1 transcriptional regulator, AraC family [Algoriphagus boritolerans DSM 17298 = JCM 18970]
MEILIKNMVCPRCIQAVKESLQALEIPFESIELGKVTLVNSLLKDQKSELAKSLSEKGFELLESKNAALISQIKSLIINQIHHSDQVMGENFSTFLSENLHQEYTSLSRLFSQVEGLTIEKYITRQKIERVKELLFYDQLSLSQIAFELNYSSVAYLSAQFKKETGMTPSEFKKSRKIDRKSLDQL